MKSLNRVFPMGKMKAITLSYDDGRIHDKRLIEIMNANSLKGTFHLNSASIGNENCIKKQDIALYKGHEISLHTASHPHLEQISKGECFSQIAKDREGLEELTGYPVTGMSYPFGSYDSQVTELLSAVGVEYCRTVASTGRYSIPDELIKWNPTCHDKALCEHSTAFVNLKPGTMSLLYIWGHSYEFEQQGRWGYIEEQLAVIGCKDDIWYATNIEIARYLRASRALITSFKCDMVYNPSAISVWIVADRVIHEIKPNELIKL